MAIGKEAQQAIASAKATEAKKTPTNTAAMMAQQQGQRTNTYLDTAAKSRAANPVSVNALGAGEREPKVESKANINVKNIVDNVAKMFTSPAKTETTTPKTNFWVGNNTSAQMAAQQGKNKNNYLDRAQSVRNATANVWTPSKNAPTSVKAAYEQGQNTNKYLDNKQQTRYAADIAQERGKAKTNYFTPQNTWTDPRDAIIDMNSDMDAADKAKAALEWAETGTTTMSAYKNDAEVKEAGEQIRNLWASGTNADAWFGKDRELVIRQGEESKNQNWWYMNTKDGKDFSNPAAIAKNQDRVVDWMNNINGYMYGGDYNDRDNYRIGWDLKDIYDAIDKGIVPDFELNMEDGNTMSAKDWVKSKQEEWSELSYQIRLDNDYVDYIRGGNTNATTTTRKIGEIDDLIRQAGDNQAHVDRLNDIREALVKNRDSDYWREMQNAALVEASLDEQEKKAKQQQENEYKSMFGGVPTLDETESEKALAKIKEQREALEKRKAELTEEYESWHMTPEVAEAIARLSDKHAYDAIARQGGIMAAQEAHDADDALVTAWRAEINLAPKYFTTSDRIAGSIESGVQGILGGLSGAAAAVASAVVDAANADWETTWNGEVLDLIRTDDRQAVIQARNTFDSYFGEGAYEKTFGNSMKIQTAEEEIARLEEENAKLVGDIPGFDPISGETLASVNANEKKIKELEKQIKDWKAADVKAGISDKPVEAYFQNHADEYDEKSQAAIAKALNGAGKVESYFIKGGKTLTEMGFDMAVGSVTGGGSLIPMWIRVFGQEASAARRDGANIYQQLAYGGAKAGIEVFTEKLFGMFDNIGYGKGMAAEMSERIVASLADTPLGMTLVRGLINAGEEGLEEYISDLLAPVADMIYREESFKDLKAEELANGLEDFILGAAMGALGFAGGIVTGQNNVLNTERYERDLTNDIIRNTDPENLTAASRAVNKVQQAKNSGNSNTAPENQLTREEYAAAKQLGLITPENEKAISPSKGSLFTDARGRIHINSSNSRTNTTSDDRRDVVIANAAREGVGLNPVEETNAPTREEQIQAEQDKAIEAEEADKAAAEEEYQAEQEARLAGIEEDNRREEESKYTDENDMSKPESEEDVSDEELAQIRHDISEEEYLDSLGTKEKTEEPATAPEIAQDEEQGSTHTEIAPETQESVKPSTAPATQPTPVSRAAQNAKATVENTQQAVGAQPQAQADATENSSSATTAMPTTEEVREAERKIKSGETNEKTVAEIVPDVDPFVSSREPVKTINENAFAKTGEPNEPTLRQKVWNFFKSHFNGVIRDAKAGPVIINERGIRNDIAHGVGEAKAATFEAVPDVLRSGDIVSRSTGGENGKSYTIAGKVMLHGTPVNVYCVVKENGVGTNKFYLHEVTDGQGNLYYQINQNKEAPSAFQDSTPQQQGSADKASTPNVPQNKTSSKRVLPSEQPSNVPDYYNDPGFQSLYSAVDTFNDLEESGQDSFDIAVDLWEKGYRNGNDVIRGEPSEQPSETKEKTEDQTNENSNENEQSLQDEIEALKRRITELEEQQQQPEESRPQPSTRKKPQQQSLKEDTQTKGSIRNSEERARDIAEEFGLSDGTYQSATRKEVSRIADYCIEKYGMENEWDRLMNKKTWDRVDFSEAGKIVLEMTKNLNRDMTRNGNRGLGKVLEKKAGETYEQYRNRQEAEDKRAYQERREPIDALLQQYADQKSTRGQELQETYNFTFADELRMRASHRFLNSQDGEVRNATDNAKSAKMWAIIDDLVTRVENAEESGSAKDLVEITKMVGRIRGRENLLGKTGAKAENWMFDRMLKLGVEKDALAALAYGNIGKIMDDLTPITYADAIQTVRVTNMLSNIATGLNNLKNNAAALRTQSLAQNASIPFAKVFEKLTGKKIAISDSSVFRGKDIRRAEEAALEYSILSSYYGMASEDGRVDLDNKGTNFYVNGTGLSGMAARALARYNFLVQAFVLNPDAPAKARARLGLQKGIEKAFEGAENTPEMIRNRKELEGYAAKETNRRVLQEDNTITNAVLYFKNHLLNKAKTPGEHVKVGGRELGSFKLGDFVMAFAKVPTNVGIQKLESTPYGALYQTIRYAGALAKAKVNPESLTTNEMARISRDIGRAATTAGMIGLGALAAMTGALKNFDDTDDDEEKKLAREKGYSGLMLNLSQIFHGGEWRDDDLIVSGNFLEILATPLTIGAMMYDASKEGMGFLNSMAYGTKKSFTGMVDAVMDIPGLQQIGDLWTSYANQKPDDGDFDKAMKAIGQFAVSSGTSYFIPNLVAQATAGADNKQRDVYTTDSYAETLRNIVMAKTPGLRRLLPEKTDTFGNTRTYGETKLGGILNTVVFPGDFKRYHVSEVETEMRRLTNEGYGKTWLDTTGPKKVEVDDEEYPLTADQRRAYHEAKAHHLLEAYDAFRTSDEYKSLTDAQRAEVYKQLKTNAEHIVKQEFMTAAEIEGEVNMSKWETLPDLDSKIRALSAKQLAGNYFDKSENEVTDYEGMDKFIKGDYAKLSDEEKDVVNSTYTYLDDIEDARENGINSEKWEMAHNIFNKYNKPDEDGNKPEANLVNSAEMWSEIQKATGFDDNGKEMQYIQDKMHLSFQGRPNTSTYDELINDYGMSRESAAKVYEKFDPLQPTEGYSTVQDRQKWNALVESGISDKEQWDAFFAMVPTNNTKQIANMHSLQGKMNPRTLKPYTFKEAIHQLELDVVYRKETLPNGKTKKYAIN